MTSRPSTPILLLAAVIAAVAVAVAVSADLTRSRGSTRAALESNPMLDPGTPLDRPAPNFTLTDQFGRRVSLAAYRGKVVVLAFVDPRCTTVCPLTTTAMLDAKRLLGAAGSRVALLGVGANPMATAIQDVRAYSEVHQMMGAWHFLTAPLPALKRVWAAYGIEAALIRGMIDHTPALYVIDPAGRERRVYMTQQSYAAVGQLGQLLAQEISSLLPGHPPVRSDLSYAEISAIDPGTPIALPRAGGGTVSLGPGPSPRLVLFFDTWDSEVTSLSRQLDALDRYEAAASTGRLPPLIAVDEASVEPSSSALARFLDGLARPLSYPVALDTSGRLADGYGVQDEPWLVLVSPAGEILWQHDVSTRGWLGETALVERVRSALARAPKAYPLGAAASRLAGSPAALTLLHEQASELLGSQGTLDMRLEELRGYPIVLNVWASWCGPCRQEFSLFAAASGRYGHRVAFLGADTDDSAGDARAFLRQHPVSYPSYQTTTEAMRSLVDLEGLPTTIFIGPAGKVLDVHTGQYGSQAALDQDVERYALGGGG